MCTLNRSLTYEWLYFTYLSFGKYWFHELCRFSKCWYISFYSIKKSCLILQQISFDSFWYFKTFLTQNWRNTFSKILICLKAQLLSLATNSLKDSFCWKDSFTCPVSKTCLPVTQFWVNYSLSISLSSKDDSMKSG